MRALITGVTGMDGSHLADQLLERGDEVYGLVRGQRTPPLPDGLQVIKGDLLDQSSLVNALRISRPEAVFNLAAITAIGLSWGSPTLVSEVTGLGVLRLLEAIRQVDESISFVQASSADQFGDAGKVCTEMTPFAPRSPYGAAKQFAHDVVVSYREAYEMRCSTAIMFNHTSPRHGDEFVVRKVTKAAAMIKAGKQSTLELGNIEVGRDWGWAPDYMRAWTLIPDHDPDDYVLATGEYNTLRRLCEIAFEAAGLSWEDHVTYDHDLGRPADVTSRIGNPSKAFRTLGWQREKPFDEMISDMVSHDLWEISR